MSKKNEQMMQLYEKYKNGKMNSIIKNLEKKEKIGNLTKEEYNQLNKMRKVQNNLSKVTNVIELKNKLQKRASSINQEIERRNKLEKANKSNEELENQLSVLMAQKEQIIKALKAKDLKPEEKTELKNKLAENEKKILKNSEDYGKNQEIFINNAKSKNDKLAKLDKEDLEKEKFELGSKVSKCNMVINNLMEGYSWDSIQVKLDNWKDRKFTSKEKVSEKASKSEVAKEILENIHRQQREEMKENEIDLKDVPEEWEKTGNGEYEVTQNALIKQPKKNIFSRFANFVKEKINKIKTRKNSKNAATMEWENILPEQQAQQEQEEQQQNQEETIENTTKSRNQEFNEYLRNIAENGLKEEARKKYEEAKKAAHKRETEKFGKDYADRSYSTDDDDAR